MGLWAQMDVSAISCATVSSNSVGYRGSFFGRPPQPKRWKPRCILLSAPRPHDVRVQNVIKDHVASPATVNESSEADRLVDNMKFSELCNEFECVSSPYVEATARQLVRDILEMREGNRALGCFAISVKYKDPLRSFIGREKYKRASWAKEALDELSVSVREMAMLSTSVLNIKWTVRGKPKISAFMFGGEMIIYINSTFTLNQISGQVIEHQEDWDVSASSRLGKAYFWASRWLYATVEAGKDVTEAADNVKNLLNKEEERSDIFPDPSGDPTKFFQTNYNPQTDIYQFGLFIAVIYLIVQFLRSTLVLSHGPPLQESFQQSSLPEFWEVVAQAQFHGLVFTCSLRVDLTLKLPSIGESVERDDDESTLMQDQDQHMDESSVGEPEEAARIVILLHLVNP